MMDFERYVAEKEHVAAVKAVARIIKDFLDYGMPIETIVDATDLPIEEVNKLLEIAKELQMEQETCEPQSR